MAKSKKRSRRKDAQVPPQPQREPIKPNPPRPNLPLVILSGSLLAAFLIYLAVIAWIATR